MSMNVNLTPLLEKMVREKVSSGLYTSQVKSSGKRCGSWMSEIRKAKLDLLRKEIRAGIESGPATVWNPDEVKEACRKRT